MGDARTAVELAGRYLVFLVGVVRGLAGAAPPADPDPAGGLSVGGRSVAIGAIAGALWGVAMGRALRRRR
jgi:hypothetical protein